MKINALEGEAELPITEKQLGFLKTLLGERDHDLALKPDEVGCLEMKRGQASRLITFLTERPYKHSIGPKYAIPGGRYAVVMSSTDEDDIGFFRVAYYINGERKILKLEQLFGAPGDFRRVVIRGDVAKTILKLIDLDPKAASLLFGHKLGVCGVCGSPLTDPISRAEGIGPICAMGKGW